MRIAGHTIDKVADNFFSQARGLMFSKPKRILFKFPFKRKWEFWMFGVKFPIKLMFLDDKYRVIEEQKAFPLTLNPISWKIYMPKKKCKYVLEIPLAQK